MMERAAANVVPLTGLNATSPEAVATGSGVVARARVASIDQLRGLVMVIMMLDHTRDFVSNYSLQYDPLDLTHTNTALFFTRWITHFCAPIFVFLAGTGAYMQKARGKSNAELARFLVTRGLWLIVLEFTLVRFGFTFNLNYGFFGAAQVIWVIGLSMIALAGLIYLPLRVIGIFGIAMILLHNLLDRIQVEPWRGPGTAAPGLAGKLWMVLHQQSAFPMFNGGPVVALIYPFIPWVGVMAAGYAFGSLYQMDAVRRRRILLRLGISLSLAFVVLRATNLYGDPQKWAQQKNAVFTVLSFLNTTKYPPSLLFLLMTLGPAMIALALFEGWGEGPIRNALVTLGRVPLFFYLLQWPTAHLLALMLSYFAGKPTTYLFGPPVGGFPPQVGFDLWVVYAAWATGVLLLYPLCAWYARVKQRRHDWWLSYL
jgi:uncharacterized membrane protein